MSSIKEVEIPLTQQDINELEAGDQVNLSGTIYTARDTAHDRLLDDLDSDDMPMELEGSVIYYVGPCPAREHQVIGSCGPTTSYRMDPFTPGLIEEGLKGMIGKGPRSEKVIESMQDRAVYFAAIGGAAAVIADSVTEAEVIAYPDLGTEAVRRLEVDQFPCIVAIDARGNNLYETGVEKYREE